MQLFSATSRRIAVNYTKLLQTSYHARSKLGENTEIPRTHHRGDTNHNQKKQTQSKPFALFASFAFFRNQKTNTIKNKRNQNLSHFPTFKRNSIGVQK